MLKMTKIRGRGFLFSLCAFGTFLLYYQIVYMNASRFHRNTKIVWQTNDSKLRDLIHAFPDPKTVERIENFVELSSRIQWQNLSVPHNLNVLFMGDSLTRYQYLDLVYFLSHNGTWVSPNDKPNFVVQSEQSGWVPYYKFTNAALQPYERCDCFHPEIRGKVEQIVENRYFYDREHNNSVTYLQKFGSHPFKSTFHVTNIHQDHSLPVVSSASKLDFVYQDYNWVDTIRNFICHLSPKPTLFVFNAGIWPHEDLINVTFQQEIVKALRECQITSVYKTTTKRRNENTRTWSTYYEEQLCNLTDFCYDLSWTALVPKKFYTDSAHFREPIYSMMNAQFLSRILPIAS